MKNVKKDTDQAYIFELNDDMRQRLQPLATYWEVWVRTHHSAEEVALQLAAFQLIAEQKTPITNEIIAERIQQDTKWGKIAELPNPHDWFEILNEEVGEAAHAKLHNDWIQYRIELIQTAAVVVSMIEHLDYHRE